MADQFLAEPPPGTPKPKRARAATPFDFPFTEHDRWAADAYANSIARQYTDGWHKTRNGYLAGLMSERQKHASEPGNA